MEDSWLNHNTNKMLLCVVVLCSLLPLVVSKPDGPPQAACASLRPSTEQGAFQLIGHTSLPQNVMYGIRPAPYTVRLLNVNVSTYQPNQDIIVAVVANQTTGRRRYKGVMMQAFHVSCASRDRSVVLVEGPPLGQFRQIGTDKESLLAPMTCHGDTDNTLAHFSPQWKINETAIWTVPGGLQGHIVFRATIVQDVNIYWTERHSRILRDPRGGDVPRCAATYSYVSHSLLLIGVTTYLMARKSD